MDNPEQSGVPDRDRTRFWATYTSKWIIMRYIATAIAVGFRQRGLSENQRPPVLQGSAPGPIPLRWQEGRLRNVPISTRVGRSGWVKFRFT